jgi:hypothetical protein
MREYLALSTARLRRLNDGDRGGSQLRDLAAQSPQLASLLSVESGDSAQDASLAPFALLANAQLIEAGQQAASMGEDGHHLLRLIAASEGASTAMLEAALATAPAPADLTGDVALQLYAIAVRAGRNPAPFAQAIAKDPRPGATQLLEFIESVRRGEDPASARLRMAELRFEGQLQALNAAWVMLGENAPASLREEVQRGLFVGERGYIARRSAVAKPAAGNSGAPPASQPARIISSPGA